MGYFAESIISANPLSAKPSQNPLNQIIVNSCQLRCRNSRRPLRPEPHLPIQDNALLRPFSFTEELALNESSHTDANFRVGQGELFPESRSQSCFADFRSVGPGLFCEYALPKLGFGADKSAFVLDANRID
jgi:hypothetical protein